MVRGGGLQAVVIPLRPPAPAARWSAVHLIGFVSRLQKPYNDMASYVSLRPKQDTSCITHLNSVPVGECMRRGNGCVLGAKVNAVSEATQKFVCNSGSTRCRSYLCRSFIFSEIEQDSMKLS